MSAGLHLLPAGAPELVRSNQKDRFYSNHISSLLSDISQQLLPLRYWLRWERELQLLAEVWYYGLTTAWGSQTLGEEYCNIVQVGPRQSHNTQQFSAPGFLRRTLAILLQLVGPYVLEKLLGDLNRRVESHSLSLQLSSRQCRLLKNILDIAEDLASTASLLHLALFYTQGVFYQIGKRVVGIRYLTVRYGLNQKSTLSSYRLLGWLVAGQVALKLLTWAWKLRKLNKSSTWHQDGNIRRRETEEVGLILTVQNSGQLSQSGTESVQLKCPLCLEVCCDLTATPCGHLFCWQCVAEWTSERSECPVCRADVEPQTLVALQHFAL